MAAPNVQPIATAETFVSTAGKLLPLKKANIGNQWLYQKRLANGIYRIEAGELEKRCAKCREYWPADNEFFHSQNRDDGLHTWCKACCADSQALRWATRGNAKTITSQVAKS